MATRKQKIAAALAAVEMLLAEETPVAAAPGLATTSGAAPTPSPWSLAGRLSLMSARMGSLQRSSRGT